MLPFGVYKDLGDLTPVVVLMISYAFFGLDAIGDEVEEPFGLDMNDLPLSSFSRMLEIEAKTRLGVGELPRPIVPVDRVLY
jgi:putative membrane protein